MYVFGKSVININKKYGKLATFYLLFRKLNKHWNMKDIYMIYTVWNNSNGYFINTLIIDENLVIFIQYM